MLKPEAFSQPMLVAGSMSFVNRVLRKTMRIDKLVLRGFKLLLNNQDYKW